MQQAHRTEGDRPEFWVVFKDTSMEPGADVAPLGEVTFILVNESDAPHDFAIVREDEERPGHTRRREHGDPDCIGMIEDVAPTQSKSATYRLDEGRYMLVSNTPGEYLGVSLFELTVQDPQGVKEPPGR